MQVPYNSNIDLSRPHSLIPQIWVSTTELPREPQFASKIQPGSMI